MWFLRIKKNDPEPREALEDAVKNLLEVKSRDPEVREVAGALRDLRKRNHFGEKLERILINGEFQ